MLSKKKINLMTKLAIYDKEKGINDKKIYRYYRVDYIGKNILFNNLILGGFLLVFFAFKYLIYILENDGIVTLNVLKEVGVGYLVWSLIIMIIYSIYNIYIYNNEYSNSKRNLDRYYRSINKLSNMK